MPTKEEKKSYQFALVKVSQGVVDAVEEITFDSENGRFFDDVIKEKRDEGEYEPGTRVAVYQLVWETII